MLHVAVYKSEIHFLDIFQERGEAKEVPQNGEVLLMDDGHHEISMFFPAPKTNMEPQKLVVCRCFSFSKGVSSASGREWGW